MTTVLKGVEVDEFYTRPDFESILRSDIANAERALVYPVTSCGALEYFDHETDSLSQPTINMYVSCDISPMLIKSMSGITTICKNNQRMSKTGVNLHMIIRMQNANAIRPRIGSPWISSTA